MCGSRMRRVLLAACFEGILGVFSGFFGSEGSREGFVGGLGWIREEGWRLGSLKVRCESLEWVNTDENEKIAELCYLFFKLSMIGVVGISVVRCRCK